MNVIQKSHVASCCRELAIILALTPGRNKKVRARFVATVRDLRNELKKFSDVPELAIVSDRICSLYYDRFEQYLSPERCQEIDQSILEDLDLLQLLIAVGHIPQTIGILPRAEA